ncbi:16S rRNA m(7)G-527 methyltransferase [Halothece sp. PCC 7418]|uniref:16S rRNA (guanine(527)-N(7))-methyltransferase RsmG n=1 Tax=Halothece sp. (strain PCC 7418) TaxID=65093 RepID=UPI0002A08C6D|nr:16S rRNA (guanine(527)-N(7))-methyltransferase RsmG [Halothece sp. PCC 7418]AFZ42492.1 16S rRNA m(7)G-527 methyltransferase [Halothece sp. PCC 7418]
MLPDLNNLWQTTLDWSPSPQQQKQFEQLYQGILAGNQQCNLTRITEPEAFWEKHLWDSLCSLIPLGLENLTTASFIDIGTGGGFPGLPCAIALPQSQITLLDSTQKKIAYLKTLISQLGLSGVNAVAARAEAFAEQRKQQENYDIALVRAVAAAPVCAEYAFPFLKVGGMAILYRGRWTVEEEAELSEALAELGGVIEDVQGFSTPISHSERHCLYLQKTEPTDARFPRPVGVANKEPLGKKPSKK